MLVKLKEWAQAHGIKPSEARRRALRATSPALKIGRDWWIDAAAPLIDHRYYPWCYMRKHMSDSEKRPLPPIIQFDITNIY